MARVKLLQARQHVMQGSDDISFGLFAQVAKLLCLHVFVGAKQQTINQGACRIRFVCGVVQVGRQFGQHALRVGQVLGLGLPDSVDGLLCRFGW